MLALAAKQPNLMVKKNTNLLFLRSLWIGIVGWAQLGSPDLGSALLFLVRGGRMAGTPPSTCCSSSMQQAGLDLKTWWWKGSRHEVGSCEVSSGLAWELT